MKDDPDHGFRVCVNALINKCLKPYASTVPLQRMKLKIYMDVSTTFKWTVSALIGLYRYVRRAKNLLPFIHPMEFTVGIDSGATPSSAVQQTAYLEALDKYIDYDEHGNLRKCLVDENVVQLRDAEGNLKTLRRRFAIYLR